MRRRLTLMLSNVALALGMLALLASLTPSASAAGRPPKPTPTPVSDPLPALNACASDIFGLSLTYTKSGGLTADVARSLNIPTTSGGTVTGSINAKATAVYGLTNNSGTQTVTYGLGAGSAKDVSISVSQASLCYLQFTSGNALPSSQDDALALLKSTFPGVPQRAPYVAKKTSTGYVFTLVAKHQVAGTDQQTAQAIVLTVTKTSKGKLIVGALSGTGSYAAAVPTK